MEKKRVLLSAVLLVLLMGFASVLWAQGVWEPQTQPNLTANIYSLCASPDGQKAWVGTYGGGMYYTTDGGQTWVPASSGVTKSIEAIQFLNDSLAYAATYGGDVLISTNGGQTWTPLATANSNALYAMAVVDSAHGWAVGKKGTILFFNGDSCVVQNSGTTENLYGVSFSDTLHGIAVGAHETALFTTDGGQTWTPSTTVPGIQGKDINDVYMIDDTLAVAVGDGFAFLDLKSVIMKTTDGGQTWTLYESDSYGNMWDVSFSDSANGVAVGDHGIIYTTNDAGDTWTHLPAQYGFTAKAAALVNGTIWVAGYNGFVLKSPDTGTTWEFASLGGDQLYSIDFASSTNGVAVGYYGFCMRTTDGGYSWTPGYIILNNTPTTIKDISFGSENAGWLVGYDGLIAKTTDGGQTWTSQMDSNIVKNLYEVYAMNDTNVWIGGYHGQLYHTTDSGTTWQKVGEGQLPSKNIKAIYFADDSVGCIGGGDSTLYYTRDGGQTWTKSWSNIGAKKDIMEMSFPSPDHGWAVAKDGYILFSPDTGKTWTLQARPTKEDLNGIYMASNTEGWVVGDKGNVFYTNDGGTTWTSVDIGATHSLKAMAKRSNAVFYASGSSSSVYKVVRENYIAHSNIKINELYVGGPANAGYFFKDQYVELYNAGTQTEYLDGKIICRLSGNITKVTYIFQFPGNGTDYPVQPGEYKVCAQSAVNWKDQYPTSIDLSHADFEFYNPDNASDPDNPDVPNIVNLYQGRRTDFMLSLTSDEVILATGADVDYTDGIDIETVIDGVEYDGKSTSKKTLDPRIDAGHFCCAVKYQGKSIERIAPGFDTNNSSVDFRLIDYPTPGLTMPVELASFTARVGANGVKLSWVTASETNNLGFEVQRSLDNQNFKTVAFIKGHGTSTASHAYSFVDKAVSPGKYYYRLKQVDVDGSFELSKVLTVSVGVPLRYALYQNYPNPFNPSTSIAFDLKKDGKVTLEVYNALGERVATLLQGKKMKAGSHNVTWKAANLPTGLYFYKISVNDFHAIHKMLLVK